MTNEEKIKAMSREELAEFIVDVYANCMGPPFCHEPFRCARVLQEESPCIDCVLLWLGEEATQ